MDKSVRVRETQGGQVTCESSPQHLNPLRISLPFCRTVSLAYMERAALGQNSENPDLPHTFLEGAENASLSRRRHKRKK
ncbi:hypothetical protein, partial [Methanothrix sp.]|uniref:hypothetical protein n=1 Tax=Methanothrix sp. TaxID=90426 RepID=UPI003C75EE65